MAQKSGHLLFIEKLSPPVLSSPKNPVPSPTMREGEGKALSYAHDERRRSTYRDLHGAILMKRQTTGDPLNSCLFVIQQWPWCAPNRRQRPWAWGWLWNAGLRERYWSSLYFLLMPSLQMFLIRSSPCTMEKQRPSLLGGRTYFVSGRRM